MDCVQNSPALSSPTEESSGRSRSHKFEYLSFPSKFFLPSLLLNSFLNQLLFKLQEGANGARSDDIKHIKEELGTWINLNYKPIKLLNPKSQDGWGLQHDVCGRLLTPIQFDWQDAEYDPAICYVFVLSLFIRVRANICNGADGFSLANRYFLACLYPTGHGTNERLSNTFWEVNYFWRSAISFMFFLLVLIFPPVGLLCYFHITILSRWIRRGNCRWAGSQEKEDNREKDSHQE